MTFDSCCTAKQLIEVFPELGLHIAKACEQAYRRGYQQGYEHGINKEPEELIWKWRFSYPYELAIAPPDKRGKNHGFSCTAIERLKMEANNSSSVVHHIADLTKDPDETHLFGIIPSKVLSKYKVTV